VIRDESAENPQHALALLGRQGLLPDLVQRQRSRWARGRDCPSWNACTTQLLLLREFELLATLLTFAALKYRNIQGLMLD
jgi:hypothetical protein